MRNSAVEIDSEPTSGGRSFKPGTGGRSAIRRALSLIIVGISALGVGCQKAPTIWSAEVRSPDGLWLASADTVQNGGFGSAAIQTSVYLKRTDVSQRRTEVLGFWCEGPAPRPYVLDNVANKGGTINLTMKWVTPSHLEVTYNGRARVDFQVVKYAGIDISVRDLSSATTGTSQ